MCCFLIGQKRERRKKKKKAHLKIIDRHTMQSFGRRFFIVAMASLRLSTKKWLTKLKLANPKRHALKTQGEEEVLRFRPLGTSPFGFPNHMMMPGVNFRWNHGQRDLDDETELKSEMWRKRGGGGGLKILAPPLSMGDREVAAVVAEQLDKVAQRRKESHDGRRKRLMMRAFPIAEGDDDTDL